MRNGCSSRRFWCAPVRAANGRCQHRLILDGIFWIARTGVPWRDLHEHFSKWGSVYRQFRRWTLAGTWGVILEALNESGSGQGSVQMIDSTIVRAHQHAADAKNGAASEASAAREGLGRSRGGNLTKIHLRTNDIGLPVAMTLSSGETSDVRGYQPVMDEPGSVPKVLIADKGYDTDAIRDDLTEQGVTPVIPHRRNRKVQEPVDGFIYALRNRIDRCFSKLKHNCRIATRYDKTADSYIGFAIIGALRLWIRHFVNTT